MMRRCLSWIWIITLQGLGFMPEAFAADSVSREFAAALEFRRIFATHAATQYSEDQIQKLIFLPNSAILDRPSAGQSSVTDVLTQHRSQLRTIMPSQLFEEARRIPHPEPFLHPRQPVTLVIIPGIFGEFIDHIPYEEIFRNKASRLARDWAAAAEGADDTDPVFDLASMELVEKPLDELVAVASLDDEAGEAETRLILLKAPKTSLESLGTLKESAAIYQRRLTKILKRLPLSGPIYVMGYSRGLNVGLELVSGTDVQTYPWMKDVRGLIGLGGVTYGSAVADRALHPDRPEGLMLQRIEQLARELEVPAADSNAVGTAALMLRNTARWAAAVRDLADLSRGMTSPSGLALENIHSDALDPGFLVRTFRDLALESFQLDRPFSDYARNIRRFQLFVREAREGIESLGTESCLKWISTHTLPARLHYYAITTTMPDPTTESQGPSALTGNTLAFEPTGLDYRGLRASYYSYLEESGMSLNDSQISLDRSPFWPELHQLANPQQKPFESTLLAILGTDHWGMAFPVAFETASGKVNPFPRTLLMKTLGDYLRSIP